MDGDFAPPPPEVKRAILESMARDLLESAKLYGLNVTIERRPLQPPRMRHNEYVVSIWDPKQ